MENGINRRTFMRNALGTAALVSVGQMAINSSVIASDLPLVAAGDPMGAALGYVDDAANADSAKYTKYEAGQECSKCIFFTGAEGDAIGPCSVFPGKAVKAGGWCSTWTVKP